MSCQREGSGNALHDGIPLLRYPFLSSEKSSPSARLLHFFGAQTGSLASAQRIVTVTFGAMVGEQSRSAGDGLRLVRVRIGSGPVGFGDVFQPARVRRGAQRSREGVSIKHRRRAPSHFAPRRKRLNICSNS